MNKIIVILIMGLVSLNLHGQDIIEIDTTILNLTDPPTLYDLDINNDKTTDFQIIWRGMLSQPHFQRHAFVKIKPYNNNLLEFEDYQTLTCNGEQDTVFDYAKTLNQGDTVFIGGNPIDRIISVIELIDLSFQWCEEYHSELGTSISVNYSWNNYVYVPIYFDLTSSYGYIQLMILNESELKIQRVVLNSEIVIDTHVEQINLENNPLFFPNPTKDIIIVDSINPEKVEILDFSGQLVGIYYKTNKINVKNYTSGIYFIRTYYNNNVYTEKLVKQ